MGICQTKLINKRHRQKDESSQCESQRCESTEEYTAMQTTKIIDLNDDCLVKIFGYLDLESLLNSADANEWLRPAAGVVYKRKFGTKKVGIYECDDFYPNILATTSYHINEEKRGIQIRIYGLKACLRYLRCFGPLIADLVIHYDHSKSKRYQYVHHYITNYCANNLTHILFMNRPKISIDNFIKPFINVTDVSFSCCKLGRQLPSFVDLFPNLHRLTVCHIRLTRGFDRAVFQHLEHLCIHVGSKKGFGAHNAANLLHMNRQLQSLEIRCLGKKIALNTLLDVIKDNQSITKLVVNFQFAIMPVNSSEVQRLISEHPLLIGLDLAQFRFIPNDAIALIQQLKSLKTFRFSMEKPSDYAELESKLDSKWIITNDGKYCRVEINLKK